MDGYGAVIPKCSLEVGAYYRGRCRNASVARWDGEKFHHWRTKWGSRFVETIHCPEDEPHFDVFVAQEKIDPPTEEIPLG